MGNGLKARKLANVLRGNGLLVSKSRKLGNGLLASGAVSWLIHLF